MSKHISNPLQQLVSKAASALPVTTGKVAVQQARIDRRRGDVVIVADVSLSMGGPAPGGRRKLDVLRDAVTATLQRIGCRLIVFSADAREDERVPTDPEANTNLVAGLLLAKRSDPGVTLVISDGQPDNAADALAIARTFRGVIDVLYIGPDSDAAASNFMRRLAAAAGGELRVNDVAKSEPIALLSHITALLPGPQS